MSALAHRRFLKMNGAGNAIVVLDLRGSDLTVAAGDVRAIARHPASAFDQLMVIHDARTPGTDAALRIYNTDGSEAGACGNGTRCVAFAMLDDPAKVMRFLRMLLALDPVEGIEELLGGEGGWETEGSRWAGGGSGTPLLEALLCALDRDPARLSEFDRTVRELRTTAEGAALLPPDLDQIWAPIRTAWMSRGGTGGER